MFRSQQITIREYVFRSQQITIREYVCTSLKLPNYLKNTEFKILKIIPGIVAAKRVAGVR